MSLPNQQLAILIQADGSVALGSADVPECGPDEVLVKIDAAAQNPADCTTYFPLVSTQF
jgi:NADPH:quinone reductase-like Zn-dependent oxidoreductase